MTREEITKVQAYLRKLLGNQRILLKTAGGPKAPVELHVGEECLGTVDKDVDEGETSYHIQIVVLAEDLA